MGITSIEWTNRSINPFRARDNAGHSGHYCEKISQGCANCYASTMQKRFQMPEYKFNTGVDGNIFLDESKLQEVLRRKAPTKYFWCDMTDMFLHLYPDDWIDKCFAVMALTPQHTHQILTKRPERMREYMKDTMAHHAEAMERYAYSLSDEQVIKGIKMPPREKGRHDVPRWYPSCLKNVWLGVSVEDRKNLSRLDILRDTPAAIRMVSMEPLLEDLGEINLDGIHWVIIGGESGPKARPMDILWAEKIVKDCRSAGVPVFMKQLGAKPYRSPDNQYGTGFEIKISDRKGKYIEEFPPDLQVREYPNE